MRKLFCIIAVVLALSSNAALALDQDIEIRILTSQITGLLNAKRNVEALPLFEQLEAMKAKPSEALDYYYLETLDKAGRGGKALERGDAYLRKYGKNGKFFEETIEIVGRRKMEAAAAAAEAAKQAIKDKELARAKAIEDEKQAMRDKEHAKAMEAYSMKLGIYRIALDDYESTARECDEIWARKRQVCRDRIYRGFTASEVEQEIKACLAGERARERKVRSSDNADSFYSACNKSDRPVKPPEPTR